MSGQEIRLGVLGCADIARRVIPAANRVPGVRVVAIGSRDHRRAAGYAARYDADPVDGYQAVLDRDDIDAVYVPLPSGLHAQWVERALRAGRHVLAEKPLTTAYSDTLALTKLAADRSLVLRENFLFVHHDQHRAVAALVADGAIGELRMIQATFTIPARPADDIRYVPELGGGALLDNGAYPVRVSRLFLGDDLTVAGASLSHGRGVDLGGTAVLHRADGVSAQLAFGLDHSYLCEYQLIGSTGRIRVERAFTPPADFTPSVLLHRGTDVRSVPLAAQDQCQAAVAAFAAAVRGDADLAADRADLLAQARLVDEIRARALT